MMLILAVIKWWLIVCGAVTVLTFLWGACIYAGQWFAWWWEE